MKNGLVLVALVCALAACQKKTAEPATADGAAAPHVTPPCAPAEQTPAERERAHKQAALDYATLEDGFLNDPKGQWARQASATSTFGESGPGGASDVNRPANIVGKPDEKNWTNDHQDMGFDSFEAVYEKPVHATEVRAVFRDGMSAVSKVEVKGADGAYATVWSGLNEDPEDQRGPRQWFVRKFDATPHPVHAVKITIANNVERGYKVVDAVQLIGE